MTASTEIHPCVMSSMPAQDLPPPKGFSPIEYRRNIPKKGPSGFAIAVFFTGVCSYGFYRVMQGRREKFELKREKLWSRLHLVPLLQAEADRDIIRRELALKRQEQEAMSEVAQDWVPGKVYATDKYVPSVVRPHPITK